MYGLSVYRALNETSPVSASNPKSNAILGGSSAVPVRRSAALSWRAWLRCRAGVKLCTCLTALGARCPETCRLLFSCAVLAAKEEAALSAGLPRLLALGIAFQFRRAWVHTGLQSFELSMPWGEVDLPLGFMAGIRLTSFDEAMKWISWSILSILGIDKLHGEGGISGISGKHAMG
jgi:hypothetical protein